MQATLGFKVLQDQTFQPIAHYCNTAQKFAAKQNLNQNVSSCVRGISHMAGVPVIWIHAVPSLSHKHVSQTNSRLLKKRLERRMNSVKVCEETSVVHVAVCVQVKFLLEVRGGWQESEILFHLTSLDRLQPLADNCSKVCYK